MRTRRLLPAVLLALLLVIAGALAHSSRRRRATISHATSPTSPSPASSALDRRAGLVVMDPMSFGEAIDQLSCQFQTPIEVDWSAMAAAHLTPRRDYPVLIELRLRDVTLRQVLAKVFDALDGGGDLAVEPAGDAARVVLKEPAWNAAAPPPRPVACLYDVSDLLAMDDFESRDGYFDDAPAPASTPLWTCFQFAAPPETQDQRLQHMVVDEVAPETWLDNGGTGVIWVAGGKMVVVHTPALQRRVAAHLAWLREFLRAPHEKGGNGVTAKP